MKKALAIALAVLMVVFAFAGCSSSEEDKLPEGQVTTGKAIIKGNDAIQFIRDSYTPEELGLADSKEDYSIMVASNGVVHDGGNYIKIVANVVTQNEGITADDGSKTFSMKTIGEYLISFDGSKVLKKDMTTENDYSELENRLADYTAKNANASTEAAK